VPERKPGITISSYVTQVSSDIPKELIHSEIFRSKVVRLGLMNIDGI
jgi:hypothetical protein